MTRLVLINGAPGSGKSTLAAALAQDVPLTLALDVDGIKHALGRWRDDAQASGLHARALALALAREQLTSGHDVVLGQYVARPAFIEELEALADAVGARFHEFVLDVGPRDLAARIAARRDGPSRAEHAVNNDLVAPGDAPGLVASLDEVRRARPRAVWLDARGSLPSTLDLLRAALT